MFRDEFMKLIGGGDQIRSIVAQEMFKFTGIKPAEPIELQSSASEPILGGTNDEEESQKSLKTKNIEDIGPVEKYFRFVIETMPEKKKVWYVRPHHIASVS